MSQIIRARITVYDPDLGVVKTLYYATQSFTTGPSDTPANTFIDGRIKQPANVIRSCFSQAATMGASQISVGEMVLVNNDGGLDALLNYSFAGRSIIIELGEVTPRDNGVTQWTTVINGTMEQAEFTWQAVRIKVRDFQQTIAQPHIQTKYGGTNSLPNGLDGVAGDLKNRPKPRIYGTVFNVTMPCVNTSRLIFQAHDGSALQSVDGVYDRGAPLTYDGVYTSQTDMETNAPAAGRYRVWNSAAGCFIRLGSNANGEVTADLTQGANTAARTAGQIFKAMLLDAGISAGAISSADIAALDTAAPYQVGYAFNHTTETTTLAALDGIAQSVGAWFAPDTSGVFRIARLDLPTGTPVAYLTATDVLRIERITPRDAGSGMPAWKMKLGYQRIWTVQEDLTNAVTAARKALVEQEYRRVEVSDSAVKTVNATSPEIGFDTLLTNATDATAEANRRHAIYKQRRDMLQVRIRVDRSLAGAIDLGKVVNLTLPRYGMNAGKNFLILGIQTDMRGYLFDLTLWG